MDAQRPFGSATFPWYDSVWLEQYEKARDWLKLNRPEALSAFEHSFDVLRTREDFRIKFFDPLFDAVTLADIRAEIAGLKPTDFELHEAKVFRRFVVHDHPFFNELQRSLLPMVSEAAGEALEPSYNFLSLYAERGVCPMHMDSPESKWTLDVCIDQSAAWPIHFGKVQAWPDSRQVANNEALLPTCMEDFDSYSLQPGQAVLFSGSSQWHYRDTMPSTSDKNFCHLIFFHYVPAGTMELANPKNWNRLFDLADMDPAK